MDALVSTQWLAEHRSPQVKVLDASWYLKTQGRDGQAEHQQARIPQAGFFDIEAISDRSSELPHMLPSEAEFAAAVSALGISSSDTVIVYDGAPMFSAPRVWWTFRAFGHDAVAVLDGGFPKWQAEGRPVESGPTAVPAPGSFSAKLRPELIRDLQAMREIVASGSAQVVDARGAGRFAGTSPEPRAGVRGGHMPGSLSLPYGQLLAEDGTLKKTEALREAFAQAGVELGRPIVTSCGSGVTASLLALGFFVLGHRAVPVYDGSWAEWGGREDTPVETGVSRRF